MSNLHEMVTGMKEKKLPDRKADNPLFARLGGNPKEASIILKRFPMANLPGIEVGGFS